ncbi:disco-interacting protein 2 isoform X5 [Condylostylus longicornis]|uniref:disco-interacting protein 2 isoform X5 n=1 Tax=Condylostylus longicornis TaxID=2530218 RepID=UPI00244E1AFA|nr:disco-interacting protein 2 isoform X5 [Condylostylus longicornis]
MKPITFESIRNFWRNKKKGKDKDGVGIMDASFKRSDSFKRISIRKSYLDRGRKRAALRARAINSNCNLNNGDNNSNINENVLIHSDSTNNAISKNLKTIIHTSSSTSNAYNICAIEPIIYEESNGKLSTKIDRSCENLTVIHNTSSSSTKSTNNSNLIKQIEVKNGIFIGLNGSIETQSQSKYSSSTKTTEISDNNDFGNSSWNKSLNHSWNSYEKLDKKFSNSDLKPNLNKNSSDKETEIQIISVDFQNNSSNSSESIYNDIVSNNEDDCSDNGQINNCKHNNISNINIVSFGTFTNESNKTDDNRSTISLTNYSEPSQYEKSNAVRLEYNSITSSNSNLNDKNLITFKTFTPAKNFLETNFDCIVDPIHQSCASINSINSKTSLNISKTNLVYHTKPLSKSQSKSIQSINSSHSIGSSNQERQQQSTNEKEKVVIHIAAQDKNDNEITDSDDTYAQVVDAFSSSSSRNFKNNSLHSPTTPTEKCKESEKVLQPAIPTKQPPVKPARKQLPVQKIPSRNSSFSDIHFSTANEITPVSKELNLIEPVSPTEKHYESFLFEQEQPDLDLYDDSNIMSPNNSIPYQLRVKTNPFTHQKELYSVNLGRVWKQLNLGQDEDLSIDISSSNQKKKNESFKSMSSRDSGFSLTLTKPKGIFRRRSKNCNQNLKGTINGGRDIRRGQIIQRNSSKRRKLKRYDINGRPIYTNNDHFLREFEEFCAVRRQRLKAYTKQSLDEIDPYCNNDTFNREISDLEAFFEEHLKRLKTYYLERKKINEETLNQFYNDFITSNEIHKKFNASSHKVESTQSNKNITGGEDTQNDYTFPYPDKRNRIKTSLNNLISNSNNNKNKKQKCLFQEVRTFANDDLKYASLIFEDQVNNNSRKKSNHKHYYENDSFHCPRPRLLQKSKHEKIPYADIDFERKCISNFPITTTKDLFDYPKHWKMTETRHHKKLQRNRRNRSGRTRQRYRKNQQFSNWPLDSYKSAKEISLAHCFPSINDPPNRSVCDKKKLNRNNSICSPIPINSDGTCCNCCKLVKNGISMSDSNDSNSNRCSLASDTDNDNDDEFSENEFLSNCDVCWDCDNQLGECICDPPKQKKQNPKKISKRNNNKSGRIASEYCKCPRVYKISTESDDNTDDNIKDIRYNKVYLNIDKNKEYINGDGSGIIASKKKIRRKKSKRKIGKNHSTLRRKYTNSTICDITQKGYEKKRTRLLQPYVNKNSQGGGGGNNGSKDNSNMPPYYNLKDHQGVGGGGGGNGGNTNNQPPPPPPIQSEGYSYVYETELPSLPSSQHRHSHHKSSSSHHGSGSGGGGGGHGQNRARRTQRRITHNEKRYHSVGVESERNSENVELFSQLAAINAEIASISSNFKGCKPYKSSAFPEPIQNISNKTQSPLMSPRFHHSNQIEKHHQQQQSQFRPNSNNLKQSSPVKVPLQQQQQHRSYINQPVISPSSSSSISQQQQQQHHHHHQQQQLHHYHNVQQNINVEQIPSSTNLLAPSAILAAVKSMASNNIKVRQEAVQQALAALKNRPKPSLPMPSKRSSVLNRSPDRDRDDTDSTTDDESIPEERISTPDREYNYPRDHISNSREQIKPPIRDSSVGGGGGGGGNIGGQHHKNFSDRRPPQNLPPPPHSDTSSAGSPPAVHRKNNYEFTDISEFQRPYVAPDITQFNNTRRGADRVTRYVNISGQEPGDTGTAGRWKVSAKIQQLLNTLKRPKRRPLPEFYEDNDIELEIAANPKDPNAPKPEGNTMSRVQGEQLTVAAGLPRNLETALQRFGTNSFKSPVATVLDPNGKLTTMLTYGKLLSRAQKIAYALTTKVFSKGPEQITLKPGDRVALVYPNSDPLNFLTAWYGCMFRGLVPLPIELPLSSSDTPPQQIGFLLSSCGISVALTSEACLKGLPKSSTGEIAKLKGWPRLHWFVTEHLPKPPKDFNVGNVRIEESSLAYIEYATDKEGSVMGVTVTRQAMMNHCRALTMACHYTEGETIVCVLDFKREVGLWHAILTSVLNGMHVVFIPYALMKLRPSSWMQLITKYRASCCLVKSRDLHWGLLATKDHKDISLSSLRMLLVADGANPWSLSSCDQFLSVFQTKGLRADAICPCASSCEVFTVSLRRPGRASGGFVQSATGRGVLSMAALSHGVVRVDSEDSLTSLTLQDCGQVMPAAQMVVVRSDGPPVLCKTDQVGEICVTSGATGTSYFGLEGLTNSTFKIQPLLEDPDTKDPANTGKTLGDEYYVRSGLLGFLGPGGLVFVCGSRDGLMTVTGRKHNADDIIATVLAVEPMRFIYRGRIAVFSIKVLRDERVCVIAEQRPDCSEEESFQWMSRVLQAVDSIHQVGIYCLALVPPNHLPKTPLGGIHLCEARRRFLEGSLHPANVLMCPHTCVTNLPKPREIHQGVQPPTTVSSSSSGCGITDTSVGPASVMVGNLVQGNRLAVAQGRDIGLSEDSERKHQLITGVLRWRANTSPDHVLYTLLNSKGTVAKTLTCSELHKRAEKIAALLQERGKVEPGDHVALIFPPGLDLICAFYGCLYLGAVPITIRPPHPQNLITTLPTVRMIVDVSKSGIVLSIQSIIKLLKSREAAASIDPKSWPPILDIDDNPKRKLAAIANATLDSTAYLDFSVSTCGRLSGVIITHRSLSSLCASLKLACELYPSRHVALCLDPYCGLGFAMWTLISVYSGHHSILIAPYEVEANPSLWLATLSQYRVRDTFCSYGVIELCTKALSNSIQALKQRNIDLRCVRTCVVVAEERPRVQLTQQFCKLFQALGLNTRCVSTSFGCRVNPAICVQGASSAESAQVYVDLRALRNNRVALVERGAPNSLCLIESGKLLPGVKVIIANPETKGHCGDSHLGEIWVQSPHNANGYFTIYGDETDYNDHFNAKLVTGSTTEVYARTGYLGFLRRTECSQAGSILDETTPSIASRDSDNESIHSMNQLQHNMSSMSIGGSGGTGIGGSGRIINDNAILSTGVIIGQNSDQELHDAVYVVGALDEVISLRGMNYHPIDIENSVLRCHKKIAECAVFTWTNLLVVVVELDGNESEALDLVPLVTNTVLEEHQLIVGVVVVVDPGVVPINSRGEKQRMHLRDGFLADQLDPIYVAYNM